MDLIKKIPTKNGEGGRTPEHETLYRSSAPAGRGEERRKESGTAEGNESRRYKQMSRSGGQSEARFPVFKSLSKLGTHLSIHCSLIYHTLVGCLNGRKVQFCKDYWIATPVLLTTKPREDRLWNSIKFEKLGLTVLKQEQNNLTVS
ncbi:hypothetical protein TNCV_4278121 [Trichonephila clavipes]|nr:hypothetical protein TNCV_4278121 [Trichonephila clavipes]